MLHAPSHARTKKRTRSHVYSLHKHISILRVNQKTVDNVIDKTKLIHAIQQSKTPLTESTDNIQMIFLGTIHCQFAYGLVRRVMNKKIRELH